MTIAEHPELPGYYRSSEGGWEFHINEDGDLEAVETAIRAWTEWRDFLISKAHGDLNEEIDFHA